MSKLVYGFSKNYLDWTKTDGKVSKTILGGKGAALVKMIADGINVPPGFTITTDACHALADASKEAETIFGLKLALNAQMKRLAGNFGFEPLVSVRSGAPVSMPGMMDTILNVGLNDQNIDVWAARIGERAAWDSYRRLIQMLGSTALGVPMVLFDNEFDHIKEIAGVEEDADLTANQLNDVVNAYKHVVSKYTKKDFPQSPREQLFAAMMAVFKSWHNPRAIEYRKINNIDPAMGTACTVQAMVFGNMGNDSGTGVLFTRDPSTGDNFVMGEFLQNAQGEDVVAGIRTPLPINIMPSLGGKWGTIRHQIKLLCAELEKSYHDMVDIEFTVQKGELFVLQSRVGKRSARAAVKIATDLVAEGVIGWDEAFKRITRDQYMVLRRPSIDPKFKTKANLIGLPACPGVVSGKPVFSSTDAINCKEPCILIGHETTPDDIGGMNAAVGILTKTGGATSHAAVVARAMDKTCVVGCTEMDIDALKKFKRITIDGATGKVWFDVEVPVVDASDDPALKALEAAALGDMPEAVTLDQPGECPQTIYAAHWWGSKDVLETVVSGIAALPDKSKITLDLRPPRFFASGDSVLEDAFGVAAQALFEMDIVDMLISKKWELQGLCIIAREGPDGQLYAHGFKQGVGGVPAEYAVFKKLAA